MSAFLLLNLSDDEPMPTRGYWEHFVHTAAIADPDDIETVATRVPGGRSYFNVLGGLDYDTEYYVWARYQGETDLGVRKTPGPFVGPVILTTTKVPATAVSGSLPSPNEDHLEPVDMAAVKVALDAIGADLATIVSLLAEAGIGSEGS